MDKTCAQCGAEYRTRHARRKFCSRQCFYESLRNEDARYHPQTRTCTICGKEFVFKWQGRPEHKGDYCSRKCQGVGLSRMDYHARGEQHGNWKGGKAKMSGGYVGIRVGDTYVLEHRLVMEEKLGRPLLPDETVHHINGDKADNRPENLEVWSSRHPKGQRVDDLLEWARETLAIYGPPRP